MGYAIHQISSSFSLPSTHALAALAAIKNLAGRETCGCEGHMHFMWINDSSDFLNTHSLEDALRVWRWNALMDEHGGIEELTFEGENLGDEDILFSVLAPYTADGSSIVVVGEDGFVWRWLFEKGSVRRQNATLVFEDSPNWTFPHA